MNIGAPISPAVQLNQTPSRPGERDGKMPQASQSSTGYTLAEVLQDTIETVNQGWPLEKWTEKAPHLLQQVQIKTFGVGLLDAMIRIADSDMRSLEAYRQAMGLVRLVQVGRVSPASFPTDDV